MNILPKGALFLVVIALAAQASAESGDSAGGLSCEIVVPSLLQDAQGEIPANLVLTNRSHQAIRICTLCQGWRGVSKGHFDVSLTPENWKSDAPTLETLLQHITTLAPGESASIPFGIIMGAEPSPNIEVSASYYIHDAFAKKLNVWHGEIAAKKLALHRPAAGGDSLIIPGQRIGGISIGMEHAEVLRMLGAPHREADLGYAADDKPQDQFADILRDDWVVPLPISADPNSGEGVFMADFVTVYCRARKVVQIEVRGVRFKTKDGISSASTGVEWRKHFSDYKTAFHQFRHTSAGGWPASKHLVIFEDAQQAGIAWRYAAMGNLAPDPDPAERVEAVAVHVPGSPMIVDPDGGSRFIWKDDPHRLSTEH